MRRRDFIKDSAVVGVGTYAAAKPGMPPRNRELCSNELVIRMAIQVHAEVLGADKSSQLAYIAVNKRGEVGGASVRRGFQFAVYKDGVNKLYDAKFLYNR